MKQKNSYNYQDLIDCGNGILFGEGNANINTVGSHTVFIGQISEVCLSPEREALIYARSAFRALAPAA